MVARPNYFLLLFCEQNCLLSNLHLFLKHTQIVSQQPNLKDGAPAKIWRILFFRAHGSKKNQPEWRWRALHNKQHISTTTKRGRDGRYVLYVLCDNLTWKKLTATIESIATMTGIRHGISIVMPLPVSPPCCEFSLSSLGSYQPGGQTRAAQPSP